MKNPNEKIVKKEITPIGWRYVFVVIACAIYLWILISKDITNCWYYGILGIVIGWSANGVWIHRKVVSTSIGTRKEIADVEKIKKYYYHHTTLVDIFEDNSSGYSFYYKRNEKGEYVYFYNSL